jgi:hypothetical protein
MIKVSLYSLVEKHVLKNILMNSSSFICDDRRKVITQNKRAQTLVTSLIGLTVRMKSRPERSVIDNSVSIIVSLLK